MNHLFNGLKGERNNCFANSPLQVICHLPALSSQIEEFAAGNPKAELANLLSDLFKKLKSGGPNFELTASKVRDLVAKNSVPPGLCAGSNQECAKVCPCYFPEFNVSFV
jgi:hypothetical protein